MPGLRLQAKDRFNPDCGTLARNGHANPMTTQRRATLAAACLVLGFASAQTPDFSGDWKMNSARSDCGPIPAPDKLAPKIEHHEPNLKVTTDGAECVNQVCGNEVQSPLKWSGEALTFDDGKTLTVDRHINSPQGELDVKIVLEKQ